jgi:lipoate-protein ligase B
VGRRDASVFLRHSPDELRALGFAFEATDRGGLVTYHGPGQLVGYPILRLSRVGLKSVPDYVRGLEEIMLKLSAHYGFTARRIEGLRGLFVGQDKIGAVGIHVNNDLTTHGFAYNVKPDMRHYDYITACGLTDHGLTSLERLGVATSVPEAARQTAALFAAEFGLSLTEAPLPEAPKEAHDAR